MTPTTPGAPQGGDARAPDTVAADLIALLAMARGVSAKGTTLKLPVDARWFVFVNGSDEAAVFHSCAVPRFHFYVEFNGWPAGLFSPFGGTIADGSEANEDTFGLALREAIRWAKPDATPSPEVTP